MTAPWREAATRAHYRALTELLIARKLQVTTMESATGGQIASLITDTEGSSAVLKGAFVTYCNEAKIMQGVPARVIEEHTVYSEETARAMADAARAAYGANIGIGVTGTMGNADPANPGASEPGEVYFALALVETGSAADGETRAFHVSIPPRESRLSYKLAVAEEIYRRLMELIG